MDSQLKALARILFQNKIFKSDGQAFEDLFTSIMSYAESDFRKIKPWGNIGDRKNDGYIQSKGIYHQVFAPEDIFKSYPDVVKKIDTDFSGLLKQWSPVNEFYFVVNDKYKGVNADSEQTLQQLKSNHNLKDSGFLTADNLERILFNITEDQILNIVGFLPNVDNISNLDYSALNEVVGYIMKLSIAVKGEVKFPDWDEKINFNQLSEYPKSLLNMGSQNLGSLDKFLSQNSFLADGLQQHITGVYNTIRDNWKDFDTNGDNIFWEIINQCSPKQEAPYQNAVIVIMSKYFESCDIFEEPRKN